MKELETKELFNGLVYNAIDFFNHALNEKQIKNNPKYSLLNFVSGVELILKARLMHEHWSLILEDPSKADFSKFKEGDFKSINSTIALERIKKILNEKIKDDYFGEIKYIRDHRNKLVHFYNQSYLNSTDPTHIKKIEDVKIEQCRTWYRLYNTLNKEWGEIFLSFKKELNLINNKIKKNKNFLKVKFSEITPELDEIRKEKIIIIDCNMPFCNYNAVVTNLKIEELPTIEKNICKVCISKNWTILSICKECEKNIEYNGNQENVVCKCGHEIETEVMLQDDFSDYIDHYEDEHSTYNIVCSDCDRKLVAEINGKYLCIFCFSEYSNIIYCENCNQRYANDSIHTLDFSAYSGCSECSGKNW